MALSELWGYRIGDEVEAQVWHPQPNTYEWIYGKVAAFTVERTIVVHLRPHTPGAFKVWIVTMPNRIRRFVVPKSLDDIEAFLAQRPTMTAEELQRGETP